MSGEISRQAFVRRALGGLAGAALLGSCRSVTPNAVSSPAPPDWTALGNQLDGRLSLPSSADYATAKGVFNSRFGGSTPVAVVAATSVADVQKAIAFAATNHIGISARSGGHSYIGASALDGTLVIDLRGLPGGVTTDTGPDAVTVTPATDLDSVQTQLAASGRSIPSGSCPTVGVAGLTLGGGLGSDARRCGLTCDALTSASLVLPSGEVVTASADDHDDVFWALRGGGGGNIGVVTSLTFRTFPATDRDVVTLAFPMEAAGEVIAGWHTWLSAADRNIWGMVNITVGDGPGRCTVILATPSGSGSAVAGDMLSAAGLSASSSRPRTLNRVDFIHYFEGGDAARVPRAFVAGSDIVGEMSSAAAESIVTAMSAWPQSAGSATAVVESLSGAVDDIATADSAFPWRAQAASVQWYTEAASDAASAWLTAAHQALGSASAGGYINYPEAGDPLSRYLGPNLQRFNTIRQKYDPTGLMRSGIGG
ncbi:FAD/FMN-containing dehydrogenase [Mycolicibacterium sp. BK556]|uniref:FAD-binding oxidoreductase n=1 Tax=unclassified Mycolicibacterium TaxID=2636767 RepID=UPI0016223962|nr:MULTISPECIES: FAD-binding oxidoreductase [unclassified Mycolicibacterium]MBB3606080.1 FAD/FMN-containing dehydrogenase [Mycolicibacterium sp. BK556]MBB3632657.1 FAD/FMN-containing dehydrogenase [Mycolicibacterium sp. BK607]